MNLHSILPASRHAPPFDYVLDESYFEQDEDGFHENSVNGTLIDLWIEDNSPYGIWMQHGDGIRYKIYVYEYNEEFDMEKIRAGDIAGLIYDSWYVDSGHIP
jgi:hypothetical protein